MLKDTYLEEVEKIFGGKQDPEIRAKFDEAFVLANKIQELDQSEKERAHALVEEILEYLFKDRFSTYFSVPWEFINSELGKMLFSLKFRVPEREYTTSEIISIMSITRALISYDCKNSGLKRIRRGRNTVILENELRNYMASKKMTREEIDFRINTFKELKQSGYKDEEIKEIIEKKVDQMFKNFKIVEH